MIYFGIFFFLKDYFGTSLEVLRVEMQTSLIAPDLILDCITHHFLKCAPEKVAEVETSQEEELFRTLLNWKKNHMMALE